MKEAERYDQYFIFLSELIYGSNFQSPGGEKLLQLLFDHESSTKYGSILEIGYGCGGNIIYFANKFSAALSGIDINPTLFEIANERISKYTASNNRVVLSIESIFNLESYGKCFDLIFSRDVLMYIHNKRDALKIIYDLLPSTGKIILIDYCRSNEKLNFDYENYIASGNLNISSLKDYHQLFKSIGFKNIKVKDMSDLFTTYLKSSVSKMERQMDQINSYAQDDIQFIIERTKRKIDWCLEGAMVWGLLVAEK